MIQAGKLRTRVTFLKPTHTENTLGEQVVTYEAFGAGWAEFVESNSREFVQAKQVQDQITHLLRFRFNKILTTQHQLQYSSGGSNRTLNILGIVNVGERNAEMLVNAVEVTSG